MIKKDYEIICDNCNNKNVFNVECEKIKFFNNETIIYRIELLNNKICEQCGFELNPKKAQLLQA